VIDTDVTVARPSVPTETVRPARPSASEFWAAHREGATLAGILLLAALLRLPALDRVPPGFFLDEASRGYDAYALARTGADQYGVRWPLFAEGLDDFTPALYTYLVLPFVAALGPTELAVRLPAALVGIASIWLAYLAAGAFFGPAVGLGTAALLAISPWHVLPSRSGAEWILLPAFAMLGTWLLRRGVAPRSNWAIDAAPPGHSERGEGSRSRAATPGPGSFAALRMTRGARLLHSGSLDGGPSLVLAGIVLGVGMYSYAFARILLPLLLVGFVVIWARHLRGRLGWVLLLGLVFAVISIPIVQFAATEAGQARLRAVVPLARLGPGDLVPYLLGNYASYFSPDFLIWGAERSHHHRLGGFGPLLPFMVPLAVLGLAEAVRRPDRPRLFWLWWLLAAPAASALHRESPSSALLLGAIPTWHAFVALGGAWLVRRAGGPARRSSAALGARSLAVLAALVGAGAVTAALAGRALYAEYPVYAAADWGDGAGEVVRFLEERRSAYDGVLVSDRLDTPHILVLFHAPIEPADYQRAPLHVRQPNVRSRGQIGPYWFGRLDEGLTRPGRHLVWAGAEEGATLFPHRAPLLTVAYPDGRPAHTVYETGG
jgi:4-amino-4-deoxy-L-arabinose transferase-like glycosyltransferase